MSATLSQFSNSRRLRLGERLMHSGHITEKQLHQALEVQNHLNIFLGQILVDLGFVNAPVVGNLLSETFRVRYADLLTTPPDPAAVALLPEDVIRETRALPVRADDNVIEVAMFDPLDVAAIDRIHQITGRRVSPILAMGSDLQRAINEFFSASVRTSEAIQDMETESEAEGEEVVGWKVRSESVEVMEAPVVRLVDSLLEDALAQRASDIHFEPQERHLSVRFRVDGTLRVQAEIPRSQMSAVISRMKVLCTMDITENRRPQDGRMRFTKHGRAFDIRASAVPAVFGEKIVLRILDKSAVMVPMSKLGFSPAQQQVFENMVRQPHGMIVVVGPTGSGKSTTLYAVLNLLNDHTRNIMTLEDPVEYNIPGLNQVQINSRIGLTFASGLRTFVRQDPDVILVGEIRDQETAEMAVQASLTGHLLLSTLHTNSAVGTISRMTNLGLDPFLIGQSLSGAVSQRLVARVCKNCAEEYRPDTSVLEAVGITPEEASKGTFRRGRGCKLCHNRGYAGRLAVYEILAMNSDLTRMIMQGASEFELQKAAEAAGMSGLRNSALAAVQAGITTPEEMARVVRLAH